MKTTRNSMNHNWRFWRPDQIAEHLPVTSNLYGRLWNELVPSFMKRVATAALMATDHSDHLEHYIDLLSDDEIQEIDDCFAAEFPEVA